MTSHEWGRVDDDGTVFVKTADGERSVGQYPEGSPEEALKFFTERYDALAFEVEPAGAADQRGRALARGGQRVGEEGARAGRRRQRRGRPGRARRPARRARTGHRDQREARKAERAQRAAESQVAEGAIVAEAEKLAEGTDWRNGANRLRELLDEWKALPRIDRASDDALWRRFSTARTAYTRRRKSHFAEQHEKRDAARVVKERLAIEAEGLADSTDWGPTAGRFRDLMKQWKAAGPAPRDVDDALWKRFRGAQDTFFGARDAATAEQDQEFAANAEVKEQLLVEAEALLPVTRPRGRQAGVARHRRALGRRRQGPPRPDEGARGPDPQGRAGHPRRRGRAVEAYRPREVGPRRRHGLQARGRPRQGSRPTSRRPAPPATRRRSRSSRRTSPPASQFLEMARKASADFSG